ncbi:Uncharacterised protein [uncultured archaeon]|nr:Uncharacterised protein [uncultured archaeon]
MTQDSKHKAVPTDEVVTALNIAQNPAQLMYPFKFVLPENCPSNWSEDLQVPFRRLGHVMSMEGTRGEKYLDTEKELVDPDRQRRIWIKRMNLGLLDGWKIVDDLIKAPMPPVHDPDNKRLAVSLISTGDWVTLEAAIFPGSESNDPSSVSKRVNAILRGPR